MQGSLLFVNHLDCHGKSNTGMNHPQPAGTSVDPAKGNSSIYICTARLRGRNQSSELPAITSTRVHVRAVKCLYGSLAMAGRIANHRWMEMLKTSLRNSKYLYRMTLYFKVVKVEKGKYWIFTEMFVSEEDTLRWNN